MTAGSKGINGNGVWIALRERVRLARHRLVVLGFRRSVAELMPLAGTR